jgi:glycosyltransferase involved in cell wall biosynthesis
VVYDIQDEYLTWTNATRDIAIREQRLLMKSDLVFTGTNSLCKKKRKWNQNIHFVQNGVENEHFSLALKGDTEIPEDLVRLPRPVIGYFGLIGDRVDVSILEILADTHPEWSIALIGPVREEMCTVPDRDNIYLMGQKEYRSLPGYLKGFDVAIVPYLLNETTMDLNPTKLLEYLSGGKPVVSTAMTDVIELFSEYVGVARNREEFLALTQQAVESPDKVLINHGIEFAREFTWESMVERMGKMILEALDRGNPSEEH